VPPAEAHQVARGGGTQAGVAAACSILDQFSELQPGLTSSPPALTGVADATGSVSTCQRFHLLSI